MLEDGENGLCVLKYAKKHCVHQYLLALWRTTPSRSMMCIVEKKEKEPIFIASGDMKRQNRVKDFTI